MLRCTVDMTNDSQASLRTDSHLILFGKNKAQVLTAPGKPSARLLNSLLHTLAPVMLRNPLPDSMDKNFRWQGENLVHRYKYRGAPSENTYYFSNGSRLDAIEIKTNDGFKQVRMEFTWAEVSRKLRLERFINHQYNQDARWDMQITYGDEKTANNSAPNRILLTLEKDGRTMRHAFRFSECALQK